MMTSSTSSHWYTAHFGQAETSRFHDDPVGVPGHMAESSTMGSLPETIIRHANWASQERLPINTEIAWHEARHWPQQADSSMHNSLAITVPVHDEVLNAPAVVPVEVDAPTHLPPKECWHWPVQGPLPPEDLSAPLFRATASAMSHSASAGALIQMMDTGVFQGEFGGAREPLASGILVESLRQRQNSALAGNADAPILAAAPVAQERLVAPERLVTPALPSSPTLLLEPGSSVIPVSLPLTMPPAAGCVHSEAPGSLNLAGMLTLPPSRGSTEVSHPALLRQDLTYSGYSLPAAAPSRTLLGATGPFTGSLTPPLGLMPPQMAPTWSLSGYA